MDKELQDNNIEMKQNSSELQFHAECKANGIRDQNNFKAISSLKLRSESNAKN